MPGEVRATEDELYIDHVLGRSSGRVRCRGKELLALISQPKPYGRSISFYVNAEPNNLNGTNMLE